MTATAGDEFAYQARRSKHMTLYYLAPLNDTSNYRLTCNFGIATELNGWMAVDRLLIDRQNSRAVLGNRNSDIPFPTGLGVTFQAKAK